MGEKHQLPTLLPSLFSSSSSWTGFAETSGSHGSPTHEQIPQEGGGRERQGVPSQTRKLRAELRHVPICCPGVYENVKALGRRMWVPIVFSWGNIFAPFRVSVSMSVKYG